MKSEKEFERLAASRCFNEAWDLLDKKGRSPRGDMDMLLLAHASRHHWAKVGGPSNLAVGDWQISRAYAAIGEPRLSLLFARSALSICEDAGLSGILPSALEGMARAHAVTGNLGKARRQLARARKLLASQKLSAEDRRIFLSQIKDTERLIRQKERFLTRARLHRQR